MSGPTPQRGNIPSGSSVLGPTWASSQAFISPAASHTSRIREATCVVWIHFGAPKSFDIISPLRRSRVDARVVLRVPARRGLELVDRADRVLRPLQSGDDPCDLGTGGVGVDRPPEPVELVLGHGVVAGRAHQPGRRQLHVEARTAFGFAVGTLVRLVRRLVLREPQVVVRTEQVERAVFGELVAQLLDRLAHDLLEPVAVVGPERLGVVRFQLFVELDRLDGQPSERHVHET